MIKRGRRRRILAGAAGAAIISIILLALSLVNTVPAPESRSGTLAAELPGKGPVATQALVLLETLAVKGKAPKTGYERTADFGRAWLDVDRNGCDTRNDILARDLTSSVKRGACTVLSGSFFEPYTGQVMNFSRGKTTSALIQIDHVVSLSNAWQTGAQQMTEAQRFRFANDPLNLLAVDGRANSQKGDGDAATWLPSYKAFRCDYVSRQVSVKARYRLWVTAAERDAMVRILTSCPTPAYPPSPQATQSLP